MSSTILLVDDEKQVLDVLASYLHANGFHVMTATNGSEALSIADAYPLALIVLDLMLPDVSGEEVCRRIRKSSRVPILMLTAKSGEQDRLTGLALGADDYLVKPFSPRELVARVRAILRRAGEYESLSDTVSIGDLLIELDKQAVSKNGRMIELTPSEYRLLTALARHPGRVWSREELIADVFGMDYRGSDRVIDTHIKNLRQKIGSPAYIRTVYGAGYRLEAPSERSG